MYNINAATAARLAINLFKPVHAKGNYASGSFGSSLI